jgi:hypothetical protein
MAGDETQVGNQVIGEGQETAVHQTRPDTEVFFSRDEPQRSEATATPPTPPPPSEERSGGGSSPAEADRISADQEDAFAEKPHLYALGAFAGAFVFAQILKKITTGDDD